MLKKLAIIPLGIFIGIFCLFSFDAAAPNGLSLSFIIPMALLLFLPLPLLPLASALKKGSKIRKYIQRIGEAIIGGYLYLLILLTVAGGICCIGYFTGAFSVHPVLLLGCVFSAEAVCLLAAGLHARKIKTVEYEIHLSAPSPGHLRAVLISDLHLGYFTTDAFLERLKDRVLKQDPEVIFLPGDLADSDFEEIRNQEKALSVLSALSSKAPICFSVGNHDIYALQNPRFNDFLERAGISILKEREMHHPLFDLYGREDKTAKRKTPEEISRLKSRKPLIVLDHRPDDIDRLLDSGVDLVLCGHTHGGQTFPGNILAKVTNKYPHGLYRKKKGKAVVTSGAGYWGLPLRLFTHNEVVLLNIFFE